MIRTTAWLLTILLSAALSLGCYTRGSLRFADHPELTGVRLAAKAEPEDYEQLGLVHAKVRGLRWCSDLAVEALGELLAEARALGGDSVRHVKFRGRWHWMGRAVCRTTPIGVSAEVRGYAARPLPPAAASRLAAPPPPAVGTITLPADPPPFESRSESECLAWQAYMDAELDHQAEEIRAELVSERAKQPASPVLDDAWRSFEALVDSRRRFIATNSEACQAAARGD